MLFKFITNQILTMPICELEKKRYPLWRIKLLIKRLEDSKECNLNEYTLKGMYCFVKLALLYLRLGEKQGMPNELLSKQTNLSKQIELRLDTVTDYDEKLLIYNYLMWFSSYIQAYEKYFLYGKEKLKLIQLEQGQYHADVGLWANHLAGEAEALGKVERAIELYELSKDIDVKLWGENHTKSAPSYHNLAYIYAVNSDYEKALDAHTALIKIREKEGHNLELVSAYNNFGYFYRDNKKYEEALSYFKKALEICREIFEAYNRNTTICYMNIAETYYVLLEYHQAKKYAEKAYNIRVKVLEKNHEDLEKVEALLKKIDTNKYVEVTDD